MHVTKHDHFSLYVKDAELSCKWYQDILGLEPKHVDVWWADGVRFVGYGNALVALFQRPANEAYTSTGMPAFNHQAFRVTREEYNAFKQRLIDKKISFQEMDHTISHSVYFQDPDDYWIELTTYEIPADS